MQLIGQPTHRMLIRYHPEIGHIFLSNLKARLPNEQGGSYLVTNSEGFRSNYEFKKQKGELPRILFLGDSFTGGHLVDNDQRFTDIIGKELNVETYNYAVSGTGTDQQVLIFEKFASGVEADLIVFCIWIENIERIILKERLFYEQSTGLYKFNPKPYFQLNKGNLELKNVPVPKERRQHQSNKNNNLFKQYLKSIKIIAELHKKLGYRKIIKKYNPENNDWKLMKAILQRLFNNVKDIPILIVPLPLPGKYSKNSTLNFQTVFNSLVNCGKNIHVMDINQSFVSLKQADKKNISFKQDYHYSPFGHKMVAAWLIDEIKKGGLIKKNGLGKDKDNNGLIASKDAANPSVNGSIYILGISSFYHDSAATLIKDGNIVAAAQEERFSRLKNDPRFPVNAINYCLEEAGIHQYDLKAIVYYDNYSQTFERIISTLSMLGKKGKYAWCSILPPWVKYKLRIPELISKYLKYDGEILQDQHHRSHAASAFYPSPFNRAAIITSDGVGEWATASIGVGNGSSIKILKQMNFPNSLGLLYSAFTQFTGFKVNSGEYKMMGLAPYGKPVYVDTILNNLVDIKEDGSIELNIKYFAFLSEPTMTNDNFSELFNGPPRNSNERITRREMDIAKSIQVVTEMAILKMAGFAKKITGEKNLCLAGGSFLNCVANGYLLKSKIFEDIWIQPAAGDAGASLGAAFDAYYTYFGNSRKVNENGQAKQKGSYWGPEFSNEEIVAFLETNNYPYKKINKEERPRLAAQFLSEGKVVGHFSGRMEFGPRALGARSILGDPRNPETQINLNLKIKYRESFRPFAPSVLKEEVSKYFEMECQSPYMMLVAQVKKERCFNFKLDDKEEDMLKILAQKRSDIPAITHIDYSARIHTVNESDHKTYYDVIKEFNNQTGYGVIVNTSFNVRGEPIICTPIDAYKCFMSTEMDILFLEDYLLYKNEQPLGNYYKGSIEKTDNKNEFNSRKDTLSKTLDKLFKRKFYPYCIDKSNTKMKLIDLNSYGKNKTLWIDIPSQSKEDIFRLPNSKSDSGYNPNIYANEILSFWHNDELKENFRPILITLLKLGEKFPLEEDKCGIISESIYVMF